MKLIIHPRNGGPDKVYDVKYLPYKASSSYLETELTSGGVIYVSKRTEWITEEDLDGGDEE